MPFDELDKALNEIRLLRLFPASSHDEPIRCRLKVASLDKNPHYEAISYVWGSPASGHTVEVDGIDRTVTANLASLLRHMRSSNKERALWIDALCIHQDDLEERKHQVSRMGKIYSTASQVIVWLGEAWAGAETALEFLRRLGSNTNLHLNPILEPSVRVNGLDIYSEELRGHVIKLFTLPWWTRTWTVQEFVLAKRLIFQCSQNFITKKEMFLAVDHFWYHKDQCCKVKALHETHPEWRISMFDAFDIAGKLDFVLVFRDGPLGGGSPYSVLTAITAFGDREVTDPRDRVYGMLGLGTGPYADLVEPDYSLTLEQVSQAVLVKSIEKTKALECFSHLVEHANSKLPSFVPNWTEGFDSKNRLSWLGSLRYFSASLNFEAQAQLVDENEMVARGVFVDTISSVTVSTRRLPFNGTKAWDKHFELAGVGAHGETPYQPTGESRLSALWQTVNVGQERYFKGKYRYHRRIDKPTDLSKYEKLRGFCGTISTDRPDLFSTDISHIRGDLKAGTYTRRFAVTENGYFTMVQPRCQPGDVIVVLLGGSVPYVLRPNKTQSSPKQCYQILGDAYVHGIMDGEALQPEGTVGQRLQEIILV